MQAFWDNGCQSEAQIVFDIADCQPLPECEVMIPNTFSPNGDGVNDGFRVYFQDACTPSSFALEVYNRWGSLVFQSEDPNASWDGRYRGRLHPQDVLVYFCRLTFPDGEVYEAKGDVTLIR